MLGFTDEFTVTELLTTTGTFIGSGSTVYGSAVDVRNFMGPGYIRIAAGSQRSALSLVPVMQFMDASVYNSILSVGQADASGTWANFTTALFTQLSTLNGNIWANSINWDAVEGRWIRVAFINNQTAGTFVAAGVAIGRAQEA
jgi:hypothetical protein